MKVLLSKKIFICSLFIFVSIVTIISCRKLDLLQEREREPKVDRISKFFDVPTNAGPKVKAIAQSIYRQNQQRNFIDKLIERVGYPHWDKAMVASKEGVNARTTTDADSSEIVYIPFSIPDSSSTAAVLSVGLNYSLTDTLYHMVYPSQYKYYSFDTTDEWNARTIFQLFTEFDYQMFNQRVINVTDGRILGGKFEDNRQIKRITGSIGGLSQGRTEAMITVCATYGAFFPARMAANPRTNQEIYFTVCNNFWVDNPNDPGPLSLPGGGSASGSYTQASGGHWDTIPPCPEERRMVRTNGQPLECSYVGWLYIWQPDLEAYFADYENWGYKHFENRDVTVEDYAKINNWGFYNIDTVGLDSCVRIILDKILGNGNPIGKMLAKMERSNDFPLNIEKFKIKIKVDTLTGNWGQTRKGYFDASTQVFTDTIIIKDSLVMNGTQLAVAQTIIHELIHAYMKSIFHRFFYNAYTANEISGLNIDTMFNVYIDTLLARHTRLNLNSWVPANPEYDHNFMADKLINEMTEMLAYIDDHRNTDEFYWVLNWDGLGKTRTLKRYWHNIPAWPPTSGYPAPSNDSTWGLKYAFTEARLDSLRRWPNRENYGSSLAKGRPKIPGGCY